MAFHYFIWHFVFSNQGAQRNIVSYRRNLEVSMTMIDAKLVHTLNKQFDQDLIYTKEITLDQLKKRNIIEKTLHWLTYHFYRFLSSKLLDRFKK